MTDAAVEGGDRRGVDLTVLADLERGKVEAEGVDLPAQVLDLPPGDTLESVPDERVGELGQLLREGGGRGVATGQRRDGAGQAGPRSPQALGDSAQTDAIRLVGKAAVERPHRAGQLLGITGEARRERTGDAAVGNLGGDRLHESGGDGLVAVEQVVGLDAQRVDRRLGRHRRVAVAVAADPAAPAQRRGRAGRAGAGASRVAGRPVVARHPTALPTGGIAGRCADVQRTVERAQQAGREGEQRLVEDGHRRAHLVQGRWSRRAEVGGPPEEGDLLAQPTPDLGVLDPRQARVVQPGGEIRDAALCREQGPSASLRRVRGEHRRHAESLDQGRDVGRRVAGGAEAPDDISDRVGQHAVAGGALAPAKRADPIALGRDVEQPKVEREGSDHGFGLVDSQRVEDPGQLGRQMLATRWIRVASEGDRAPPDRLHRVEHAGARLLHDDLPEQRTEKADLAAERIAGRPDADRHRLRPERRVDASWHQTAAGDAGPSAAPRRRAPGPPPEGGPTGPRLVSW